MALCDEHYHFLLQKEGAHAPLSPRWPSGRVGGGMTHDVQLGRLPRGCCVLRGEGAGERGLRDGTCGTEFDPAFRRYDKAKLAQEQTKKKADGRTRCTSPPIGSPKCP